MKQINVSIFGRPNIGKTTLMEALQALCLAKQVPASLMALPRRNGGDITCEMFTVLSGTQVWFRWNPGGVIYLEKAIKSLLKEGEIGICVFDPDYESYRESYYDELFRLVTLEGKKKKLRWLYAVNQIDRVATTLEALCLPVPENELSKVSAWYGMGVMDFLVKITNEVKEHEGLVLED